MFETFTTLDIKYTPLPSQAEFHALRSRFKGFSGPIGSGKSQALCHEAIRLSYVNAGRTGLIGAPTYPMLRDATQAALLEILNESRIPYEFNKADGVLVFTDTGSRILLRAVDEFERLRGTNLAWFGLDELSYTLPGAWLRLVGRLRDPKATEHCGFAVWTPKGYDWVYQKFIKDPADGYAAIQAKPFENRHVLENVPDYYEQLKTSYDENFYRQEVLGDYLNVRGGLVYSAFSRDKNVCTMQADPALPVFWALDFNVDPMCSVVVQIRGGEIRVLDEIVLRRASTEQACEEFEKRFGRQFGNLQGGVVVYGDASGNAMQTTGLSDYEMIREFFRARSVRVTYKVPRANPAVRERVALMNAKLCNARRDAALFVSPRCKELIDDFEQVCYRDDSTQIDKESDRRRTHVSDALGYLVWQESRSGSVGERSQRLL